MRSKNYLKVSERRRKRVFTPMLYFLLEVVVVWLVFSIVEENFFMTQWSFWTVLIFGVLFLYSLLKTIYIYRRQKDYPKA